jgi:hypothetical protein
MPNHAELKNLVSQLPDPDKNGTYANLDQGKIEQMDKAVAQLAGGGRDALVGLIDMLVEPGKGDDIKAHFAVHLWAVHVSHKGNEQARVEFARGLAAQLGGSRPKTVQAYLIQELQLVGGKESVEALGKALLDPDLCDGAARALASIREGAAEQLLTALPTVQGRNRVTLVEKLAVLRAPQAAEAFKRALGDADSDVRIAAAWGIARIADASAAEALLKCADARQGWERINQTDACMALAEGLAVAGKKSEAAAIYTHLQKTRTDASDRHIRDAAARALAAGG